MLLPNLTAKRTFRETTDSWAGYNHNLRIGDGELYDMRNLTSDHMPVLSTRKMRGWYAHAGYGANGLIAKDALCYVDGPDFVINEYRVDMGLTDSKKQLVSMGAYVIILPDKKYINTADLSDFGSIEASFTTEGPVTFTLARVDGTELGADIVSPTPPENPEEGIHWIDTSGSPHVLKTWSAASAMWVSIAVTYVKIQCANIGKCFNQYDGVTISGLSGAALIDAETGEEIENADISGIDGSFAIWEKGDDFIVIIGMLDAGATIRNSFTVARKMPLMDFVIERDNRLWGCRYGENMAGEVVNEIYASKQGDFRNWFCFMGLSTDSYIASVGTDGRFTGAVNYKGYGMFWKEDVLHKVYGTQPSNFQVQAIPCRGVMIGAEDTLATVNETLFYKSRAGICAYEGGMPVDISAPLGDTVYYGGAAGGHGSKYYISLRDAGGAWSLFVYDAARGVWHREDDLHALCFCSARNELYCIDAADRNIKAMLGSGDPCEDDVPWMAETGDIGLAQPDAKFLKSLYIRVRMEQGARMSAAVQYDSSGQWLPVSRIVCSSKRSFDIPVRLRRCDHFRLRLEGVGQTQIYALVKNIEYGSTRTKGEGRVTV